MRSRSDLQYQGNISPRFYKACISTVNKNNSNFDKGESKSGENFDYKIMATNPQEKYPE